MIVEMGMIRGIHECLKSIFTWSMVFPDHLGQVQMFLKNMLQSNGPMVQWADGQMDGRRSLESLMLVFTWSSTFLDHPVYIKCSGIIQY